MTTTNNYRPCFRERVHALAGHSAWREPGTASGTSHLRAIPADHVIAAALSFGRRSPDDIGPDIAFDIAIGRMGHKNRVCVALGNAMARDRSRLIHRNRQFIGNVVWAAYARVCELHGTVPKPEPMDAQEWATLVEAAAVILTSLAENALNLAERKHKRAA